MYQNTKQQHFFYLYIITNDIGSSVFVIISCIFILFRILKLFVSLINSKSSGLKSTYLNVINTL